MITFEEFFVKLMVDEPFREKIVDPKKRAGALQDIGVKDPKVVDAVDQLFNAKSFISDISNLIKNMEHNKSLQN